MGTPRAAELAHLDLAFRWNRARGTPEIPPGSSQEQAALDRIDELRAEDRARVTDTFPSRQKRARQYWGRAGRARS